MTGLLAHFVYWCTFGHINEMPLDETKAVFAALIQDPEVIDFTPVNNSEFYDKLKASLYGITVEASVSYNDAKDAFNRLLEEEYNV